MDFRYYVAFISEWLGAVAVAWLLTISPRFQRPPIGFKYARRDGLAALALYALILAFAFVFYSFVPPALTQPVRIAPAPVNEPGQALLLGTLCLLPFLAALAVRRQPARSIGWNRALLMPGLQAGVAIALLTIFLRNRFMDILAGQANDKMLPLIFALGIGLVEETIFRGYIQLRLAWWLGPIPGIALTAALGAIWHLAAWLNRLPLDTILILLGLTFVQGLVLGWIMRKAGHVLAPGLYRSVSIWMQFLA